MPAPEPPGTLLARRFLIAVLLQVVVTGCSRPRPGNDGVRVEMNVTPQPPAAGIARVEIVIRDAQGQPLEAASVALEGNMSHAGMKPSFATAKRDRPGRWLADLDLTMGGDWLVLVQVRLEDGREIQRTIKLPGVESR